MFFCPLNEEFCHDFRYAEEELSAASYIKGFFHLPRSVRAGRSERITGIFLYAFFRRVADDSSGTVCVADRCGDLHHRKMGEWVEDYVVARASRGNPEARSPISGPFSSSVQLVYLNSRGTKSVKLRRHTCHVCAPSVSTLSNLMFRDASQLLNWRLFFIKLSSLPQAIHKSLMVEASF
jgi:hypothetical protein